VTGSKAVEFMFAIHYANFQERSLHSCHIAREFSKHIKHVVLLSRQLSARGEARGSFPARYIPRDLIMLHSSLDLPH
jgi:hypothetical protein